MRKVSREYLIFLYHGLNRRGEIERFFEMVKPVIKNKLKVNKVNSYVGGR